ncbi:2,3-butanediol dehydrogenase [Nocardia jinanensis]|uniref:(R,R)-butanediol dehydrogenase n=1 Tax=Nocardia jinanensis TaxID=382504 RepID=A0A917RMC8_9NOCA|nr:2,3-butanediol dehydrogenase [Nocardia jinanensis]GGL13533.1 (R,R)-butanediol dehydrogenase [Nocardia jinanensis]
MRALRLHGPRDARLEEIPEPELRPGTVKVHVEWAGICGSDLGLYESAPIPADYANPIMGETGPHTLGHEFSGYVTAVAEDVTGVAVGDLVAVQPNFADGTCAECLAGRPNLCDNFAFIGINGWGGGFSDTVVVPADHALVLPAGFSAETAALIEPLAVAWHAVELAGVNQRSTALVVGAGPIGLSLVLALRAHGVETVFVTELSASRKELALRLGADRIIDPREEEVVGAVRAATGGRGVDVAFDASGVGKATLQPAIDALAAAGTAVVVANFHGDVPLDVVPFLTREKVLTGSFAYTAADFREVRDAVVDGRIRPDALISSRVSLTHALDRGIEHLLADGRATEVKILVTPREI